MTLEELQVVITAKTGALQKEFKSVSKQLNGLQSSTKKSMDGIQSNINKATAGVSGAFKKLKAGLIALGIGKVIKDSFNLARTYEASIGQINRLLGQNSAAFQKWVDKNTLTFGLARAQAMKYASVYGNLLTGFIPDTKEVTEYTQELLKASSIIASNTGRTMEDVNERIRSGLLGNTEAIEDLGVNVNVALLQTTDAFKQLANGKSWNKLSFQTQQQIRLMAILEQTSKKFGDNIQQNTNFQLMQLSANLKNIGLNIGQAFMPIVSIVLPILNSMAMALSNVTAKVAEFMNMLFGTNFTQGAGQVAQVGVSTGDASSGFGDMANSADEAGESAKKAGKAAKNALAGFDEVNTLAKDSGKGESRDTGSGAVNQATSQIEQASNSLENRLSSTVDAIKREFDRLKSIFVDGFNVGVGDVNFDNIKQSAEGVKQSIIDIFRDSKVLKSASSMVDSVVLALGKNVGAVTSVGITIATNLLGGIDKYLEQNGSFIKARLIGIFDAVADIYNIWGDFVVVFADIFSVFGGETGQQITGDIISMFSNSFLGATELALLWGKDLLNCITQPIIENKDKIKKGIEGLLQPIQVATSSIKDLVTNTFSKILEAYRTYIEPAYKNIKEGLSNLLSTCLDVFNDNIIPVLDNVSNKFREMYEQYLQPAIDSAIECFGKLFRAGSEVYKNCIVPLCGYVVKIFGPSFQLVFNTIVSVVATAASWILNSLKLIFDNLGLLIDFVTNVFKGNWEDAFKNISEMFKNCGQTILDMIDLLKKLFMDLISYIGTYFKQSWENAWNNMKVFFTGICNTFESIFKNPLDKGLNWLKSTFTGGWSSAWNSLSKTFTNIWDGMKNGARNSINGIIGHINKMINGINNKLRFEMPDILGGGKVGFSIPNVPMLARGGIVDGATFMGNYVAGEAGKEMIVPLENTSFVNKLAGALGNAVMMAMQLNSGNATSSGDTPIVLEIDGREIARGLINPLKKETERIGVSFG